MKHLIFYKTALNRLNLRKIGFTKSATMWHNLRMKERDRLLDYTENLQSQGRLVFNASEARKALNQTENAFQKASKRLIQKNKLFRPAKGFYAIIPAQYRSAKGLPPEWYIDALMKFHDLPYYVGLLSAAALYGAAHQAPQELQVVTTKPLRLIVAGRTRIRFLTKQGISKTPVQDLKTQTGFFKVSTPEGTAFDLIRYYRWAGFLNNVATVLSELSGRLDPKKLISMARNGVDISHVQRLGYLLEKFGEKLALGDLSDWISDHSKNFVPLRPGWRGEVTARDLKWRILVNEQVESDI